MSPRPLGSVSVPFCRAGDGDKATVVAMAWLPGVAPRLRCHVPGWPSAGRAAVAGAGGAAMPCRTRPVHLAPVPGPGDGCGGKGQGGHAPARGSCPRSRAPFCFGAAAAGGGGVGPGGAVWAPQSLWGLLATCGLGDQQVTLVVTPGLRALRPREPPPPLGCRTRSVAAAGRTDGWTDGLCERQGWRRRRRGGQDQHRPRQPCTRHLYNPQICNLLLFSPPP